MPIKSFILSQNCGTTWCIVFTEKAASSHIWPCYFPKISAATIWPYSATLSPCQKLSREDWWVPLASWFFLEGLNWPLNNGGVHICSHIYLVGGLEPWNFMTFHLLGIMIPTDFNIFQRGWYTTKQLLFLNVFSTMLIDMFPDVWLRWLIGITTAEISRSVNCFKCQGDLNYCI